MEAQWQVTCKDPWRDFQLKGSLPPCHIGPRKCPELGIQQNVPMAAVRVSELSPTPHPPGGRAVVTVEEGKAGAESLRMAELC